MLNGQLIDVVNSGSAWGFIGNGCSLGTGIPSWEELLNRTITQCESSSGILPAPLVKQIDTYMKQWRLTDAFSVVKKQYGNNVVDDVVAQIISVVTMPSEASKIITSWPLAGYITTNYDHLLEKCLINYGGWIPIGNTADENKKMSGDISKVVWHPHGGASLGEKNNRLVLATTDYDEIYPNGSPTLAALEAFFRMKRLVFVGFGFRDPDLIMTLERVGRFITPSRPAFAFLANADEKQQNEYWEKYKIKVISYRAKGCDHSDLLSVLSGYGAFILDKSTRFGSVTATPNYDPEAVGLLTNNRLIRSGWEPEPEKFACVARGLILSMLNKSSNVSIKEISRKVLQHGQAMDVVTNTIKELIGRGYVEVYGDDIRITSEGEQFKSIGKADFEVLRDQFASSLLSRATSFTTDGRAAENIRDVVGRYLEKICRDRGVGVFQQLVESGETQIKARAVALLQDAKSELSYAIDRDVALLVIKMISDVLTSAKPEEKKYLGILTQAYFARHLVGLDPSTIGIKLKGLAQTVFICDSNITIPLLAEGSIGHEYALSLFSKIAEKGSPVITSDWLLEECAEHARWAWDLLKEYGPASYQVIDAARGAQYKQNGFLIGYLNHPNFGPDVFFKRYFSYIFNDDGERPNIDTVSSALVKRGVLLQHLDQWNGFSEQLFMDRDDVQKEIERRRKHNGTYKRERQVKAEAEVVITVTGIRRNLLRLDGRDTQDGYFLSHSRVVDNIQGYARRISIYPESLLEWILSHGEVSASDADALYDQMLWELSSSGMDLVSRQQMLCMFSNTIDVSRHRLDEIISEHRDIIREKYGSDPETAFHDVDPLAVPELVEELNRNVMQKLNERLAQERKLRVEAVQIANKAIKNVKDYERLKAEKKAKKDKGKRRERAQASKPGRNKNKK